MSVVESSAPTLLRMHIYTINININITFKLFFNNSFSSGFLAIKKFDVNGVIRNKSTCFFVKPQDSKILELIHENGFIILYGHRGTGIERKTDMTMK